MGLEKIRDWIDARYVGLDIHVLPCTPPTPVLPNLGHEKILQVSDWLLDFGSMV